MGKFTIALTPIDKFFFGSDMTFGAEGRDDLNEDFKSYIITSRMFPQQTSLLGMLRFLILSNDSRCFSRGRITDKDAASELIGANSFSVNATADKNGKANSFGIIKSISACRIQAVSRKNGIDNVEDLFFEPLYRNAAPVWDKANPAKINQIEVTIPELAYSAKEGGIACVLSNGVEKYYLEKEGDETKYIFLEDRRVGINRDINSGSTLNSSLFKQISYRFNNSDNQSFRFAFDAVVDNESLDSYSGQMVSVGADGSWFVLDIQKAEAETSSDCNKKERMLTLQSPAFIPRLAMCHVKFAITSLLPFRFMQSNVMNTQEYRITDRSYKRSEKKYLLYDSGSVFYFDEADDKNKFEKYLKAQEDFRQIGYNEYK